MKFGFIGLGLIGASIAKAFRNTYKDCFIVAYNRSEKPRLLAKSEGVADIVTDSIDSNFNDCDYIFLCTPVEFNESYLKLLKPIIKSDCIITDVGSVKGNIHKAVISEGLEANFIGGHPMAGSEKTGYEYSSATLCVDAPYPITPTPYTSPDKLKEYVDLVYGIGAKPIVMDYEEHDRTVAAISHLPHLVAAELANLVNECDSKQQYMKLLASTGFKDTTRIAASSTDVWEQICITNRENISEFLGIYITKLQEVKKHLDTESGSEIYKIFDNSREYRNEF